MTAADFWEVGASGRCYSREFVLDIVAERHQNPVPDVWTASGFQCRKLAEDVYLLTYTLLQDGKRETRRSTIWQRAGQDWKIIYHQGTIVEDFDPLG